MKVASWNVNSIRARLDLVSEYVAHDRPDVLAVQETRCSDARFPWREFDEWGYEVAHLGRGGHAGVAIASRVGLDRVRYGFGGEHGPPFDEPRLLAADCGGARVVTVYVPNGRRIRTAAWEFKLLWLDLLRIELELELHETTDLLVVGDFNVCPSPIDSYDPSRRDRNLVSTPERERIGALIELGLSDLARSLHPEDPGFTWFSYSPQSLDAGRGFRLDLALASPTIRNRATECRPALAWRRPDIGPSDHAPLVTQLDAINPS